MFSLKKHKKTSRIEIDFYPDEQRDLSETSVQYVNLVEEIDRIFEKSLEQCHDKRTINTVALLRGAIYARLNDHRTRMVRDMKDISDKGFDYLKEYSANFFNAYHGQKIVIDKKGFQLLFEPMLSTYLDYQSILLQNVYNTLGGKNEEQLEGQQNQGYSENTNLEEDAEDDQNDKEPVKMTKIANMSIKVMEEI